MYILKGNTSTNTDSKYLYLYLYFIKMYELSKIQINAKMVWNNFTD